MVKNDFKLLFIFIILAALIFIKSYVNMMDIKSGITKYLQLAQNLKDNKGFYFTDFSKPEGSTYFALWPCAYPYLIFILSKLTGSSVFWASKLLNVIFIALSFMLFRYFFREKAFWFGLIYFINSILLTSTITWSEVPFMFGLLAFCLSIFYYLKLNYSVNTWQQAPSTVQCSLFLFLLYSFFYAAI